MSFNFAVQPREEKLELVRFRGKLPGVLYGPGIKPVSLVADYPVFEKLYKEAGESSLIDLQIEGKKQELAKVLIQDVQYDSVKQRIIHFDLRQIKMDEEMTANVSLTFINEAPAVKEASGTLNTALSEVEVKCLPKDLVSEITVDLSLLKTFEDSIYVRDLQLPAGITVLTNRDTLIAKVTPPLTEEQIKAMEASWAAAPSAAEVPVEEKKAEEPKEGEEVVEKKEKAE